MEKPRQWIRWTVFLAVIIFTAAAVLAQGPADNEPDTGIDATARREALNVLKEDLREAYVFPEMGDKLAKMLEDSQAKGEYDSITSAKEFAKLLTAQMHDIAHDGHLRVWYSPQVIPASPNGMQPPPDPRRRERQRKKNYAFEVVQCLHGNIGYLKINGFDSTSLAGPTAVSAMGFLANTDAMIIDVRDNRGGSLRMVELLVSYFFSDQRPVLLNDFASRTKGTRNYEHIQSWTLPFVPGQRYLNKEVYILTSHRTFSGGEEFTYDMQTQKRATIVGEVTGGGAHNTQELRIGDHFSASIPYGHPINPITKTDWEGVGVKPDIEVPQEDALNAAEKTALEHLIAKTSDEQELDTLRDALRNVVKMQRGKK